jgi:hypothetical protein
MHLVCRAVGNLQNFSVLRKAGQTKFTGDLESITFYGDDNLPSLPAFVFLHSETAYPKTRSEPGSPVGVSDPSEPRQDMKSGVWLGVWQNKGEMWYSLYLMLGAKDFEYFMTMVTLHLGEDIEIDFSFQKQDVSVAREEFLRVGGKNIVIPDADIEFGFRSRRSTVNS